MPNETVKKRRILPWVIISLVVLMLSSAAFVLSVPLDLTRFKDRVEAVIEEEVNGEVRLGRIVLKVLPAPELTLAQIKAMHKGGEIFSADRLFARVRLLPLLTGKVSFEAVEADNPSILLVRGRDGVLNLNDFLKKKKRPEKAEPEKPEKKAAKPSIEHLKIANGRFSFIDRFPMQTASFNISGINSSAADTDRGTAFTAVGLLAPSTPVTLKGTLKDSAVDGQATVRNLDLFAFNPYIKAQDARITAIVDADLAYKLNKVNVTTADVRYKGLSASYPTTWDVPLVSSSGSGKMSLTTGKGIFDLTVGDIVLNMDGYTVKGSVHVEGPKKKKSLEIIATSTPVSLRKFLSLLPTKKMSREASARVRSVVPLGGTVTVRELKLAGPVKELRGTGILRNPRIVADLSIDGASFRYRDLKTPFTSVSGELSYRDRVFNITDLTGRYSRQILDDLDGTLKNLSEEGSYKVAAKGSFDIKDTLSLAESRTSGKIKERLSALDADGVAAISANIEGAVRGGAQLRYSGDMTLNNGSAYYKGVPVGLEAIDASLAFDNDRITLYKVQARTDSSSIALSGLVEGYRGKDPYFKFQSDGSLTGETLGKALATGPEKINMSGAAPFTLSAEGRKKDFRAKAFVDATGAGLFIKKYIDKAAGFPLRLDVEGGLHGDVAAIDNASLAFGGSAISGSGTKTLSSPVYNASLVSEQLSLSDFDKLSPFLDSGYATSGALSFRLKASRTSAEASPMYEGKMNIKDGSFETGLLKNRVHNVTASAEFKGNKASLVVDRLETGTTILEGRLDLLDIAERTLIFSLNFPRLHAEDLTPGKKSDEPKEDSGKAPGTKDKKKKRKPIIGSGVIRAAEGDLWNHQFKSLSADVRLTTDTIEINPVSLDVDGGEATSSVVIFLNEDEPRLFTSDITSKGLHIEKVTGARSPRKFLNGTARTRIHLTGMKGEGPLMKRINGTGNVFIENGRLWKFGFITDIFSLVNIISLDELFKTGLPYKDISGNFRMGRGIISTSDLAFDSNSLRMSAVGSVRVPENTIDLTLALHPFVTIDRILSQIPLAGWIITGKEESTVSFYFDVEGPMKKPEVTPLPVKTIEKSIFGILERLLKAPFKLFD